MHPVKAAMPHRKPYIATANYASGDLQRYDATTGAYIDSIGSLPIRRSEIHLGPDGSFYVTIPFEIKRIDAVTGATTQFIDASQFGNVRGIDFGPNGNLFVASPDLNAILEFNGRTGQYIREFITGIPTPIDLDFAPDGSLFVARGHHESSPSSSILHYDGQSGNLIRTFATNHVATPQSILVDPSGDVFVTNQSPGAEPLVGFKGSTGAIKFAVSGGLNNPQGMTFGINGELLVASWDDTIKRFDANTGLFLGNLITRGFLNNPIGVVFVPEPSALLLLLGSALLIATHRRGRQL
jgi:DNA-binding beta-propeller fold protein YncE